MTHAEAKTIINSFKRLNVFLSPTERSIVAQAVSNIENSKVISKELGKKLVDIAVNYKLIKR